MNFKLNNNLLKKFKINKNTNSICKINEYDKNYYDLFYNMKTKLKKQANYLFFIKLGNGLKIRKYQEI